MNTQEIRGHLKCIVYVFIGGEQFYTLRCLCKTFLFVRVIGILIRIKNKKHVLCAFIAWWKLRQTFRRVQEQTSENSRHSRGFLPAQEFSLTLPRISPGYECIENMFYNFYKIMIFCLNKEKDDIWNTYSIYTSILFTKP